MTKFEFGYFDNDTRCDVLTEKGGEWVLSSGGTGRPYSIGRFETPLKDVAFGRFDPSERDYRPGKNRRTTHAFRSKDGQWQIARLFNEEPPLLDERIRWTTIGSSGFPMEKLRFGDFTGDGVTDVLAVEEGKWAISESARHGWRNHNPYLSNDVGSTSLFIADLDNNNVDDILWLGGRSDPCQEVKLKKHLHGGYLTMDVHGGGPSPNMFGLIPLWSDHHLGSPSQVDLPGLRAAVFC